MSLSQAPERVLPVRAGVSRPPRGLARPPEVAARPRGVRDGVAHQQPALRRAVAEAVEAALPGRGIKIHTFLAFLFVILPNKHRPSFMGTFVIAIHRVARNIYGPALPCTFVINKTPGGQF